MRSEESPEDSRAGPTGIPLRDGRFLDLSQSPLIMGILNATPDSFHAESRLTDPEEGARRAFEMAEQGADLVDVGGESSRPGSRPVSAEVEIQRIVPLIEAIRRLTDVPISIDTRKAQVAGLAVKAGADIINDISAFRDDPEMTRTAADLQVPVVLMHMQGTPLTMQIDPHYEEPLAEIMEELSTFVETVVEGGVSREKIILDPGIGFGKRVEDNLALIRGIPKLKGLGYPILIGLSRKGFLGTLTQRRATEERLAATLAANAYAALAGADILRVHDVRETVELKRVLRAITAVS